MRGDIQSLTEELEPDLFDTYCTDYEDYSHCDHVTEAVPDWLANQVLFKYLNKIKNDKSKNWSNKDFANAITNSIRINCQNFINSNNFKTYFGEKEHPEAKRRINHIAAVHPGLRGLMGCKTKPQDAIYCNGKKTPAPTYNQPSSKARGAK